MFFDGLMYLLGKILFFTGSIAWGGSFLKPLSKEDEAEAIKRLKAGDPEAKELLINHNMRLVAHVVKKYSGVAENDDLISVGSIGLIKAINTFEPEKGTQLATYTARCIENEILMMLRVNKKYKNDTYLSEPVGADKDGNELTIMDVLSDKDGDVFSKVDREIENEKLLKIIKEVLTPREYKVIVLRYGLKGGRNYAQREVAAFLRISRSYISRIEKKAIEKLQAALSDKDFYC